MMSHNLRWSKFCGNFKKNCSYLQKVLNHDMTNSEKQNCRGDTSLQNIKIINPSKIRCRDRCFINNRVVYWYKTKWPRKSQYRSSRLRVFYKSGALEKLENFSRKYFVPKYLFNKVVGLQPTTLFKKETPPQVFSWNSIMKLRPMKNIELWIMNTSDKSCEYY